MISLRTRFALLLLMCVVDAREGFGDTAISGTLASDSTWSTSGSPYVVTGSFWIPTGKTLTIDAGVVVKFNSGAGLLVDGDLQANGTASFGITFTSSASSPVRGAWSSVELRGPSPDLTYVTVSYAGAASPSAAIRVFSGSPTLDHVTITESSSSAIWSSSTGALTATSLVVSNCSSHGVWIEKDSSTQTGLHSFTSSTISSNGGDGVRVRNGGVASIVDTTIDNNTGYAISTVGGAHLQSVNGSTGSGNGGGAKNGIEFQNSFITARDQVWLASASLPHFITGNVDVGASRTLTVKAGATVKFAAGVQLRTYGGRIVADGTSAAPILFTSSASSPTRGAWRNIDLLETADTSTSVFRHVTVQYAAGADGYAFRVYKGSATLDNVTITESAAVGLYIQTAGIVSLTSTTISNCTSHGVMIERSGAQTGLQSIASSTVTSNGGDGVRIWNGGRASVTNSSINANTGYAISMRAGGDLESIAGTTATGNGGGSKNGVEFQSSGIADRDMTWRANPALPYFVTGGVDIYSNRTLTIEPGTTVKFTWRESGLRVYGGRLVAEGTAAAPIHFVSAAQTPARGDWRNIDVIQAGSNPGLTLRHVTVSHAGSADGFAVRIANGSAIIEDSVVTPRQP